MDEAEKYQQRLQAIAEKRRVQAEEERVRRETEEEWLKVVQQQRKSLRDQWLMEPTPGSAEPWGLGPMPGHSARRTEESADQVKVMHAQIKEDEDETENVNDDHSQIVDNSFTLSVSNIEKSTYLEANPGQGANKVLGGVAVQEEREVKTGSPTSTMAFQSSVAPPGEAVLDDEQHTLCEIKGRPHSGIELTQVREVHSELSVQTTLCNVAHTCNEASCGGQMKRTAGTKETEVEPPANAIGGIIDLGPDTLQQKKAPEEVLHGSLGDSKTESEMALGQNERRDEETEDRDGGTEGEGDVEEDEWEMVYCSPEKGLSNLTFLDFTQAQADLGVPYKEPSDGAVLKVEQDCIADEEHHPAVGPSQTKCKLKELPKSEEPMPESAASIPSCLDGSQGDMQPEVTLRTVCFDKNVASGTSLPLLKLNNVVGKLPADEASEDSTEIQPNLPRPPANSTDVVEVAKERICDFTEATRENSEEQGTSTARTGAEVEEVGKMLRNESIDKGFEDEAFQEVPLDGKSEFSQSVTKRETLAQSNEPELELPTLAPLSETPHRAKGETSPKTQSCQCCTVM